MCYLANNEAGLGRNGEEVRQVRVSVKNSTFNKKGVDMGVDFKLGTRAYSYNPILWRLRQEDCMFKVRLYYLEKSCHKRKPRRG